MPAPTYLDPLNGVSISEAQAEAATVAPVDRVMLTTLEFRHPSLEAPVRIVADNDDLFATLEAGAPVDPSTEVEFMASAVRVGKAEESDTEGSPQVPIELDNVNGVISAALRIARGSLTPWQVTERVYASDELDAPAIMPPLTLELSEVTMDNVTASFKAAFGEAPSTGIPKLIFKSTEYPGLSAR